LFVVCPICVFVVVAVLLLLFVIALRMYPTGCW
jgi:hypothetical protein